MNVFRSFLACAALAALAACNGASGSTTTNALPMAQRVATKRHIIVPQPKPQTGVHRMDSTGALADGGFESGGTTYWQQCGSVNAAIVSDRVHSGTYADLNGQTSSPEINGDSGLCQQVTIPANGQLTFWVYEGTNERATTYAWQEADLLDNTGATVVNFFTEVANTNGWVQRTYDASTYAGQTLWLYFGVHGNGYARGTIYQYVDDVAWSSGATPTPTPAATPTPVDGAPTPIPHPGGPPNGSACGTSCGVQRWHIKTLDDATRTDINWTPVLGNVSDLASMPVPAGYDQYNDTSRYAPAETQAYRIRALLVGWKIENDHDYHIVIADVNNPSNTMIVEPPDLNCSAACDSGFGSMYDAVRTKLINCFGSPTTSFVSFPSGIVVDVTGIPLFDALHGQTGVAPNGIELHPMLSMDFISGTTCQ